MYTNVGVEVFVNILFNCLLRLGSIMQQKNEKKNINRCADSRRDRKKSAERSSIENEKSINKT